MLCSSVTLAGLCTDNPTLCPGGQLSWNGGDRAVVPDACCGSTLPGTLLSDGSVASTAGGSSGQCTWAVREGDSSQPLLQLCSAASVTGLCTDNPSLCPQNTLTWFGGDRVIIPDSCCGATLPGRLLPDSSIISTAGDSSSTCSYYIPPGEGTAHVRQACPGLSIPDICTLSPNLCDSMGRLQWYGTEVAMLPDWCCRGISPGRLLDTGAVANIAADPQLGPPPTSLNCDGGVCKYAGFICLQDHPCAGWLNVQDYTSGSLCGPCDGSIPAACPSSEPSTSNTLSSTVKSLLCNTLFSKLGCKAVSYVCLDLYWGCRLICQAIQARPP